MIKRLIQSTIEASFKPGKVTVILGPRQVGKTTLLNQITGNCTGKILRLNCDDADDAAILSGRSSTELRNLIEPFDMVTADEVQRLSDIGLTLKKIGDLKLHTKVIVTGSSSLDISSKINEPATGRITQFKLYPLSLPELASHSSEREENRMIEHRLIYGCYPEVVTDSSEARHILMELTNDYLYKDLFALGGIKKPDMLQKLVRALALQVGSEVSYNELSLLLGIDKVTVESYIDLLEKCFVVFRLESFSRNLRNEIKKGKKIYFYDNGVRNAVLSNFAPMELRNDCGALWENMMISERLKQNAYLRNYAQLYFWRTHSQSEIDLLEILDGKISSFEFKYGKKTSARQPLSFQEAYPQTPFSIITPENFWPFVKAETADNPSG